jgi:hypothetical protein
MQFYEVQDGGPTGRTQECSEYQMTLMDDGFFRSHYHYGNNRYAPVNPEELRGAFYIDNSVLRILGVNNILGDVAKGEPRVVAYLVLTGKAEMPQDPYKTFMSDVYYKYMQIGVEAMPIEPYYIEPAKQLGLDLDEYRHAFIRDNKIPQWGYHGDRRLSDLLMNEWKRQHEAELNAMHFFVIGEQEKPLAFTYSHCPYLYLSYLSFSDVWKEDRFLTPFEIFGESIYYAEVQSVRKSVPTCLPRNPFMPDKMRCVIREIVTADDFATVRTQYGYYGGIGDWQSVVGSKSRVFVVAYPRTIISMQFGPAKWNAKDENGNDLGPTWQVLNTEALVGSKRPSSDSLDKLLGYIMEVAGRNFPVIEKVPFREITQEEYEARQSAALKA